MMTIIIYNHLTISCWSILMSKKEQIDRAINNIINLFFSNDFKAETQINRMISQLDDDNDYNSLMGNLKKQWVDNNNRIEEEINRDYKNKIGTNELKQLIMNKKRYIDHYYKIVPSMKDLSEEEFQKMLPVYKLIHYHDIFMERLEGLDMRNIDINTEKLIIKSLQRDAYGLSTREVLLFYNLVKSNIISMNEDEYEIKIRKIKYDLPKLAKMFIDGVLQYISGSIITKLNSGVPINKDELINIIANTIRKKGIEVRPYIVLFDTKHNEKLIQNFISMKELISNLNLEPDRMIHYTMLRMIFKNIPVEQLDIINLNPRVVEFVQGQTGLLSGYETALTIILDTFFYVLCRQIYDVNRKYHSSNENRKSKLEKLYKNSNRLGMMIINSLSRAFQEGDLIEIDTSKLQRAFVSYIRKYKYFITQEDLFNPIYDF